ncbi:MAG: mechanosensitive ion channel family protein [Deltaproteobacteria bacterium]|nr:MAG: mechanosensitive ion channel family protein [Deltaproteobacteria bacterium]
MASWVDELIGISPDTLAHLMDTVLVVLAYLLLRRLSRRVLLRRVEEPNRRYFIGKGITYVLSILAILVIAKIWIKSDINLATYLGILSAGLAIALQDPIVNMAGWLFLMVRQPFRVGDRVQVGKLRGDVIDIRLFMFTLLEIGNWVDAEQSTGRIVHVPNGQVFKTPLSNYTQGFEFIWHEIPVTVTFESDWQKARRILERIAGEQAERLDEHMARQIRELGDKWRIHFHHLTPIVWLKVCDFGVTLTIRYLCRPRNRRGSEDRIWQSVLQAFADEPDIDLAYPTQRFYQNHLEGKPGTGGPVPSPPGGE